MKPDTETTTRASLATRWLLAAVGVVLVWSYWPALREMAGQWGRDPRYSHGFLVPLFAVYLLWDRREQGGGAWFGNPTWYGLPVLLGGVALMLAGARYYVDWLAGVSIVPTLLGVVLLAGGWPLLRRTGAPIAFLVFMVPLPYQLEVAVGAPLQRVGTLASNYILQTLGLNAVAEGNVILLEHAKVGVVEACNGLGMIFMFSAFTTGAVMVLRRPLLDKILILLSTVPIALAANVLRITVTAVLSETVGRRVADAVYHDFAGWIMMPVALGMLAVELWLLARLFVERPSQPPGPLVSFAE